MKRSRGANDTTPLLGFKGTLAPIVTLLTLVFLVAIGAFVYSAVRTADLREEVSTLQQNLDELTILTSASSSLSVSISISSSPGLSSTTSPSVSPSNFPDPLDFPFGSCDSNPKIVLLDTSPLSHQDFPKRLGEWSRISPEGSYVVDSEDYFFNSSGNVYQKNSEFLEEIMGADLFGHWTIAGFQIGPFLHGLNVSTVHFLEGGWPGPAFSQPVDVLYKYEIRASGFESQIGIGLLGNEEEGASRDGKIEFVFYNVSADPSYFETVIENKGIQNIVYSTNETEFENPCALFLLIVESKDSSEACAPGFLEQRAEDIEWCLCYDTCGNWVDGKLCEGWNINNAMDRFDILNCGSDNHRSLSLSARAGEWEYETIRSLDSVFHGICIPPEITAEQLESMNPHSYEVTATVRVEQTSGPVVVEPLEKTFSIANTSFHYFSNYTATPFHDWLIDLMVVNETHPTNESSWKIDINVERKRGQTMNTETCTLDITYENVTKNGGGA